MVALTLTEIRTQSKANFLEAFSSLPPPQYRQHGGPRSLLFLHYRHAADIKVGTTSEGDTVWAFISDEGKVHCFGDCRKGRWSGREFVFHEPEFFTFGEPFCYIFSNSTAPVCDEKEKQAAEPIAPWLDHRFEVFVRYFDLVAGDDPAIRGRSWKVISGSDLPYDFMTVFREACEVVQNGQMIRDRITGLTSPGTSEGGLSRTSHTSVAGLSNADVDSGNEEQRGSGCEPSDFKANAAVTDEALQTLRTELEALKREHTAVLVRLHPTEIKLADAEERISRVEENLEAQRRTFADRAEADQQRATRDLVGNMRRQSFLGRSFTMMGAKLPRS